MNRLFSFLSSALERVNPIVVKEFRQAVQNRMVVTVLLLFLLVNLLVVGGSVLLSRDAGASATLGQDVFSGLLGVLLFTCIGFVPAYTAIRLSLERRDANVDLLFITTITPGAIVRGKFFSALALTILIFSACMPFLTLTYLLRGIDLLTIFFSLGMSLCICAGANMLGVFVGSVPASALVRSIIGAIFGIGLLMMFQSIMMLVVAGPVFWGAVGVTWTGFSAAGGLFLLMELLACGLLYVLAVAFLSPKTSNRMLVPRLYVMGAWAITGGVLGLWGYLKSDVEPMEAWVTCCGVFFSVALFVALGERDTWTPRVRRYIPRMPLWRAAAFLLYSGAAGGIAWAVLMFIATTLTAWAWSQFSGVSALSRYPPIAALSERLMHRCAEMSVFFSYILCYCLTTVAMRLTFLKRASTVVLPWVAAIFGSVGCVLMPYVIASLTSSRSWDPDPRWRLLSPLALDATYGRQVWDLFMPVLIVWLVISIAASWRWVIGQWRRFIPCGGEEPAVPILAAVVGPALEGSDP